MTKVKKQSRTKSFTNIMTKVKNHKNSKFDKKGPEHLELLLL